MSKKAYKNDVSELIVIPEKNMLDNIGQDPRNKAMAALIKDYNLLCAATLIKRECKRHEEGCGDCIFNNDGCILNMQPRDWKLKGVDSE